MKIAYLTQYAVDGQNQSQFFNYSRLIGPEFEVAVYYLFPFDKGERLVDDYRKAGVEVQSLQFTGSRISLSNLRRFVKTFAKSDFDILHSQHPIAGFYSKVGGTILRLFYRKKFKIIVEQRCVRKNLSKPARMLESVTHPLADLVVCSSDSVEKSYFKSVHFLPELLAGKKIKHLTFYNSIDTSAFSTGTAKKHPGKKEIHICTVGRHEAVKQPLLVLEALRRLGRPEVLLQMAGHGSLDNPIQEYINTHGLGQQVKLLGNIDWVAELLQKSDIYINFSKNEGLCKSLLEAMATGTPVIVSKVEGNVEVVGGDSVYGLAVPPQDTDALAEAISQLIDHPERYEHYSVAGRDRVTEFDVTRKVREMEQLYRFIGR